MFQFFGVFWLFFLAFPIYKKYWKASGNEVFIYCFFLNIYIYKISSPPASMILLVCFTLSVTFHIIRKVKCLLVNKKSLHNKAFYVIHAPIACLSWLFPSSFFGPSYISRNCSSWSTAIHGMQNDCYCNCMIITVFYYCFQIAVLTFWFSPILYHPSPCLLDCQLLLFFLPSWWKDKWFAILSHFHKYSSHIRTIRGS